MVEKQKKTSFTILVKIAVPDYQTYFLKVQPMGWDRKLNSVGDVVKNRKNSN
jgi:hypothetical protein